MRVDKIIVELFSELTVVSYKGIKQVNEHGKVNMEGNIPCLMTGKWLLSTGKKRNILKADIVPALGSGRSGHEYMA